jgi:hypothetical protein
MKKQKHGRTHPLSPPPVPGGADEAAREEAMKILGAQQGGGARDRIRADVRRRLLDRAGEYVKEGKYPFALSEIQRVYVINPNDVEARQYEQVIRQLIARDRPAMNPLSPLHVGVAGVVPEGETDSTVEVVRAPDSDGPHRMSLRDRLLKTKRTWRLIPPSDPAPGV